MQFEVNAMTKLQKARKDKGFTVIQLAQKVGLDPSTVNRIERGVQECNRDKARDLAAALGVDVLDVIFNKPHEEKAA